MSTTGKRRRPGGQSTRGGRNYTPASERRKAAAQPKRRTPPSKRPARRGPVGFLGFVIAWVFRLIWRLLSRGALVAALISGAGIVYYATTLPDADTLMDARTRGSVTVLDRDGEVFAWRGKQYGGSVTAESVAPVLKSAVVATEDKRFYRHFGVSPRGIASAIRINMREGRGPLSGHGGSTITQQAAKLICMGVPFDKDIWDSERAYEADCRAGSLWRQVKEMPFAVAREPKYSRDEIPSI